MVTPPEQRPDPEARSDEGPAPVALPRVSLLVAMRNEQRHIEHCLESILAQDYPPELIETLVYDGRSTDASREIAERLIAGRPGWLVADNPGLVQSHGWNLGIERASGDIVGIVSAHAELAPDYVRQAVETLGRTGADLVGGPVHAHGVTYVGAAVAAATSSPFGVGNARAHYTDHEEEVDTVFQGLCLKEMYERIGSFDVEMVRNQDDELSYRLREHGGRIVCNPAIRSVYYNRGTVRTLARQYFNYGFWKVRVMQKLPRQMQGRQFVPASFVVALAGSAALAPLLHRRRRRVRRRGGLVRRREPCRVGRRGPPRGTALPADPPRRLRHPAPQLRHRVPRRAAPLVPPPPGSGGAAPHPGRASASLDVEVAGGSDSHTGKESPGARRTWSQCGCFCSES